MAKIKIEATTIKKVAKAAGKKKTADVKAEKKGKGRTLKLVTAKVVKVYEKAGTYAKAAAVLGCSAASVKYHVKKHRDAIEDQKAHPYSF